MQTTRNGCAVYLELMIEFTQRKTSKLLGRRTRRFATASSSLSLWKPIDWNRVFIVRGTARWIWHTFLLDFHQPQTARRMPPGFTRFFAGYYTKTEITSQKHIKRHSSTSLEHLFQIHFHNEKGWSTKLRLANPLYIICVHLSDYLEVFLLRNHLGWMNQRFHVQHWHACCSSC